ncbi:MAG: hypothetical protein ACK40G_01495 [Cytophagaceae bacterium]
MINKLFVLFILVLYLPSTALPQNKNGVNNKSLIRAEGSIGITGNKNILAINIGGVATRLIIKEDWAIGLGAFPSLFMSTTRTEPKLGLSPRLEYKNFALIAPVYHFTTPAPGEWVWTFGLLYIIGNWQ